MINITDPRTITQEQIDKLGPFLVLANTTDDVVADVINLRTRGNYDHAMVCVRAGKFCSQGLTYKEVPMEDYMKQGSQLKFISLVGANPAFNFSFTQAVLNRLALPWWKRFYDFIGIFGQAINCPWIHTPGLMYCSVVDISLLKQCSINLPGQANTVIQAIPNESNPQDIDSIAKIYPDIFNTYGIYLSDEGVIV